MSAGVVTTITTDWRGDTLTADVLSSATVLPVSSVVDFDEAGGTLVVGDSDPLTYLSADEDANTVTLAATVGAGYEAGLPVNVWDPSVAGGGAQVVEYVATVELHDGSGSLDAVIPHSTIPTSGVDYLIGASVRVEAAEDGEWFLGEVLGREPSVDQSVIDSPLWRGYLAADYGPLPANVDAGVTQWVERTGHPTLTLDPADGEVVFGVDGVYLLLVTIRWADNTSGSRGTQFLFVNPDATFETVAARWESPTSLGESLQQLSAVARLTTGQRLRVQVRQRSGGALSIVGDSAGLNSSLQIARLSA